MARSADRPGLVVVAVGLGLFIAAVDLSLVAAKRLALDRLAFVSRDVWWTLPLTTVSTFACIGLTFALASRITRLDFWSKPMLFTCVLLGASSILLNFNSLHSWAILALAAGIAVQATRLTLIHQILFSFGTRRAVAWALVLAMSVGAAVRADRWWDERQALTSLPPAPTGVPNVLLIVLDTVRAANLSLYGYSRPTTPHLTQWAARGAVFSNAFSTAPWTLPSHASILTGRLESELSADWMRPLDSRFPTLPESLSSLGYSTAAFIGNTVYVNSEVGLARGFAYFDSSNLGVGQLLNNDPLGQLLLHQRKLDRILGLGTVPFCKKAPDVTGPFLRWSGSRNGPWFALLNYFDAHEPYESPEPFFNRFATSAIRPAIKPPEEDPAWTPRDAEQFKAAYDGGIAYLDAELAGLFAELDRRGQLASTVVIVTSDHGEEFGEHHRFGHGESLYQTALHVPLIVFGPERVPSGVVVARPVSLRDIPATVLNLVGAPAAGFPGESLSRFWRQSADVPDEIVISGVRRTIGQPESHPLSKGDAASLIDDQYHYIYYFGTGAEVLFDLRSDPWELSDLSGNPRVEERLKRFRIALGRIPGMDSAR